MDRKLHSDTEVQPGTEGPIVVRVTRRFAVSAERVFDAWLDPAHVGEWLFATPTGKMVQVEIDARVGGHFLIVEQRDGVDVHHRGDYLEIDRPRRLMFTFGDEYLTEPARVQVDIVPLKSGCELTLTHEMSAKFAGFKDSVQQGWTGILQGLEQVISQPPADEQAIVVTRIFDAPRALVFKAWTEPEHLVRWWAPKGCSTPFCKVDLRPGGKFHYCIRLPEGRDIWGMGIYREILAPSRLVFTDSFADAQGKPVPPSHYGMSAGHPAESLVTVTFDEHEGKTRLTLRHAIPVSTVERKGAEQGWREMLQRLAGILEKN